MVEWIVAMLAVVGFGALGSFLWYRIRIYRIFKDAKLLIEEYKAKCNEVNRFVISEQELRKIYPSISENVIREVWKQLVMERAVDRDPIDGEWCIRK